MINDGLPSWAMVMAILVCRMFVPMLSRGKDYGHRVELLHIASTHPGSSIRSQFVGFGVIASDSESMRQVTEPWNPGLMKTHTGHRSIN